MQNNPWFQQMRRLPVHVFHPALWGRVWQRFTLALVAALCMFWPQAARAQDAAPAAATGAQATMTLVPVADVTIDGLPQYVVASGSDPEIRVVRQPDGVANALLRFDVSALPAGAVIDSATLHLYQVQADVNAPTVVLPLHRVLEAWDEATVTWGNRPAYEEVAVAEITSPAENEVEVMAEISATVEGWVSGSFANEGLEITFGANDYNFLRAFSSREGVKPPRLTISYTLPPLRICREQIDDCDPAEGAIVSIVGTQETRTADKDGFVDAAGLALGRQVWVRWPVESGADGVLYYTTPAVMTIEAPHFIFRSDMERWEMPLAVTRQKPLWIQDLDLSAQWYVEASPGEVARLRNRIAKASDYLYSFTDGQFALGRVTVHQLYDEWGAANIQLYANNVLQPKAIIGGIVAAERADFDPGVLVRYAPGAISMGSYWNRFGSPPNSLNVFESVVYNENDIADDWSLALAHELGHYLLYLFDTYTGVDGMSDLELTKICTGSAMGDVYRPANQNFIFDPTHWSTKCKDTEAFARLNGRTEWATIAGWYTWAVPPVSVLPGPAAPPAGLTTVTFVAPQTTPGPAAPGLFNLDYRDGETSSGEARAFLYQSGRLVEQGKPPEGSTTLAVTGANIGDRLCVYDVNEYAAMNDEPRHQFACTQIVAGNDVIVMTKEETWNPLISLVQVGPDRLQIVARAVVPANRQMHVRLFPEHQTALAPIVLPRQGDVFSATVTLTEPVPALYAQLFVNETPPAPNSRRELVADRGTGGGGAFGPAKAYGGALVVSSDGNAAFEFANDLSLAAGQSIAWQSMPGAPPLPLFMVISGQSYRLDAWPPTLVANGAVHIMYDDLFGLQAGSAAGAESAAGLTNAAIYFWNGHLWRRLPTQLATPVGATDGKRMASAPSQGIGVYAVLADLPGSSINYLPTMRVKAK